MAAGAIEEFWAPCLLDSHLFRCVPETWAVHIPAPVSFRAISMYEVDAKTGFLRLLELDGSAFVAFVALPALASFPASSPALLAA